MKFAHVVIALGVLFALTVGGVGVVAADNNAGHGNDCDGNDEDNPSPERKSEGVNDNALDNRQSKHCETK